MCIVCVPCLTSAVEAGHRRTASDRHFKPLLPSTPCGPADNGNLIGGRAEQAAGGGGAREGEVRGSSFVRNSSKLWPSYLSTGALCNGILHCHFAPFIFRQGYYCSHTRHIPLRLCVQGQVLAYFFFFFTMIRTSVISPSPHTKY